MSFTENPGIKNPGLSGTLAGTGAKTLLAMFTAAIFTSAFLLFFVQPMFTKMVLPLLGGSPAVWSVAMVVFQALLLAGYCYAHLSTKWLGLTRSTIVHLTLLIVTFLILPIGVTNALGEAPAEGQASWLVGVFLLSVGLPFFALAGNGPLLQSWFARSGHPQAEDPYFLYGASNLGSFAALILYPILFEPLLRLKNQSTAWSFGFGVLIVLIAGAAYLLAQNAPKATESAVTVQDDAEAAPDLKQIFRWILLSAIPSGLLVAVTAHLSTDVAAVPFLWVVPLSLFLLTFVLIFRDSPLMPMGLISRVLPLLAVATVYFSVASGAFFLLAIILHCLFFFAAALQCHHALYQLRPKASRLTQFYLYMSLGGVIGGLLCGLIAPMVFNRVIEYPVLAILSLLALPKVSEEPLHKWRKQAFIAVAVGVVVFSLVVLAADQPSAALGMIAAIFMAGCAILALFFLRRPVVVLAGLMVLFLGTNVLRSIVMTEIAERSFFGVHKIETREDGRFRILNHGTTVHGAMRILKEDGTPDTGRPQPLTYYHPDGPINAALIATPGAETGRNLGVVGLGTGAHACNGATKDSWTFFEIDPLVIRIAKNPEHFRFLSTCAPEARIVTGDARLSLVKERDGLFDNLLIDAFSSDSIPVHLMTREALELYLAKLAPKGILTMHISNRHMELAGVVGALAREAGLAALPLHYPGGSGGTGYGASTPSTVVALARQGETLAPLAEKGWKPIPASEIRPWTDDFSDIISAIWRHYRP